MSGRFRWLPPLGVNTASSDSQQKSNNCTCRSQWTSFALEEVEKSAGPGCNITAASTPIGSSQQYALQARHCVQINGIRKVELDSFDGNDTIRFIPKFELLRNIFTHYRMTKYVDTSFEELRFKDYQTDLTNLPRFIEETLDKHHGNTNTATENIGTKTVKFRPVNGDIETSSRKGSRRKICTRFQCIVFIKEYGNKSFEKLRFEDYQAGLKTLLRSTEETAEEHYENTSASSTLSKPVTSNDDWSLSTASSLETISDDNTSASNALSKTVTETTELSSGTASLSSFENATATSTVTSKSPPLFTENNQFPCGTASPSMQSLDFVTTSNSKTSLPEPTLEGIAQCTEVSVTIPPLESIIAGRTTSDTATPLSSTPFSSVTQGTVSIGTTSTTSASFVSTPLQLSTQSGGFSFGTPLSLPSMTTAAFRTSSNVNTVFSIALLTSKAQSTGFSVTKPPIMSPVALGTTSATNTPFSSTPFSPVTQGSGCLLKSAPTSTVAFGFGTTSTTSTPIETISTPSTQSIKFSIGTNIPLTSSVSITAASITSPSFFSSSLTSTTQSEGFSFGTPPPMMATAAFATSCNTCTTFSNALMTPTTQSNKFPATPPMTSTIAFQLTTQSQGFSFGTPLVCGRTSNTSTSSIPSTATTQSSALFFEPALRTISTAVPGTISDIKVSNAVSTPSAKINGFSFKCRLVSTRRSL